MNEFDNFNSWVARHFGDDLVGWLLRPCKVDVCGFHFRFAVSHNTFVIVTTPPTTSSWDVVLDYVGGSNQNTGHQMIHCLAYRLCFTQFNLLFYSITAQWSVVQRSTLLGCKLGSVLHLPTSPYFWLFFFFFFYWILM